MSDFRTFFSNCLAAEADKESAPQIDVFMFRVAFKPADQISKEEFEKLIKEHEPEFGEPINLMDGKEHSYIELGGWIGSQENALLLMALCEHLKMGKVLHPRNMMPTVPAELQRKMAGGGMISLLCGELPEKISALLESAKGQAKTAT